MSRVDLSVFHEFAPPPTGGGHQFMRALCSELESRGLTLEYNRLSRRTPACLCNSYNFHLRKLAWLLRWRRGVRCVHRIDGPLQTYRGFDDGTDAMISKFNHRFADATVVQSAFSLDQHQALGLSARNPVLISNTPDASVFHANGKEPFDPNRPLKVVSVSWSDNPNKGLETYQWLDEHVDSNELDITFVGRIQTELKRVRHLEPMPSDDLAAFLRTQDVYLTASRKDPCSNSVVEALACGLPVVYLDSGGHPELVGDAGLAFTTPEEIPATLRTLKEGYRKKQEKISIPSLTNIADQYLQILEIP